MYLKADNQYDVFKRYLSRIDADDIYYLVCPAKLKLKGSTPTFPLDRAYAGNKISLTYYLNDLEKIIDQYPNLPILVSGSNHSVFLKYNALNPDKPWLYVDADDFQKFPGNRNLNTNDLVDNLFYSLSENSEYIVFNMKLVAESSDPVNKNKSLRQFAATYKINKNNAAMYDKYNAGLLYIACREGHIDTVKLLLAQEGIEINKAREDGVTPFYIACYMGHKGIVELLLAQEGIEINEAIYDGATALYIACQEGYEGIVELLLAQKGIEINKAEEDGATPLYIACQKRRVGVVRRLLAHEDIEINKAKDDGATPLLIACFMGHTEIVELLLVQQGIKVNKSKDDDVTPFYIACYKGHKGIVELLLTQKDIKINEARYDGTTPLYIACQEGHEGIVELLLAQKGIKINETKEDGATPLYIACQKGRVGIVRRLLAHEDIEINEARYDGATPLLIACLKGYLPVVNLLLQANNVDVNAMDLENFTPLLVACLSSATQGLNELFRLLLENKADPCHKNAKGKTALDLAFLRNNTAAIEALFLHAKNNDISLGSLMSAETIEKARHWSLCKPATSDKNSFFKPDCSLEDLKDFVQKKLGTENNVLIQGNNAIGLF